jgi:predicted nucleic acid-binding protein
MIYLDSSSLLKLLWNERESSAVIGAVAVEETVVVSVLAELETLVQLKAAYHGGDYALPRLRRLEAQLAVLRNQPPYVFHTLPGTIFQTAFRQHRNSRNMHARTLDRLHLAAMDELKISRLMTNDKRQAAVAIEVGFEVVCPRAD